MELKTQEIDLDEIELGGPVKNYNYHTEDSIQELAENIKEIGLINPITVWWNNEEDCYQVAAGERRFRAIRQLGWDEVDTKVIDPDGNKDILQYQVSENRIREYSWLIEARQIYDLMKGEKGANKKFINNLFNLGSTQTRERRQIGYLLSLSSLEMKDLFPADSAGKRNSPNLSMTAMSQVASGLLRPSKEGGGGKQLKEKEFYNPFSQKIIDKYLRKATKRNWTADQARAEMLDLRLNNIKDQYKQKVNTKVNKKLDKKVEEAREEEQEKLENQISELEADLDEIEDEKVNLEDRLIEAQEEDSKEVETLRGRLDKVTNQRNELEGEKEALNEELEEKKDELEEEEKKRIREELRPDVKRDVKEEVQEELSKKEEKLEKKKSKLEEKEKNVKERKEKIEKKEEDLESLAQRKPRSYLKEILSNVKALQGQIMNIDKKMLSLFGDDGCVEMAEEFRQLAVYMNTINNQIKGVINDEKEEEIIDLIEGNLE